VASNNGNFFYSSCPPWWATDCGPEQDSNLLLAFASSVILGFGPHREPLLLWRIDFLLGRDLKKDKYSRCLGDLMEIFSVGGVLYPVIS
jgi:hypothetical protein